MQEVAIILKMFVCSLYVLELPQMYFYSLKYFFFDLHYK